MIRRTLYKFFQWVNQSQEEALISTADYPIDSPRHFDNNQSIRFEIHRANGGMVIETRRYIAKNDENRTSLYIVNDTEDIGDMIKKIITIESLKS